MVLKVDLYVLSTACYLWIEWIGFGQRFLGGKP